MVTDGRTALVFPGQGSQYVGMGQLVYAAVPAARAVFHQAQALLGLPLARLCFEGPADDLDDAANAQVAIFTVSTAYLAAWREVGGGSNGGRAAVRCLAGHSAGLYAALVAAGALDFADALWLVRERGRLMRNQSQRQPGAMAAVAGLGRAMLEAVCQQACAATGASVVVAGQNAPTEVVLSGDPRALARAIRDARARGARRIVPLRIAMASHAPMMAPAAGRLTHALARVPLRDAELPVVSTRDGRFRTRAVELREELAGHMLAPVEWLAAVERMRAHGVDTVVEVGPGGVLSRLIGRLETGMRAYSLDRPPVGRVSATVAEPPRAGASPCLR